MATFMDLPLEVRNMIYEYCLVKNSILVPFEEFYPLRPEDLAFRKDLPSVALLRVNKSIEAETAPILYGKNVWRVSVKVTYFTPPSYPPTAGPISSLWEHRGPLFRKVILVFDQRDVNFHEVMNDTLVTTYYSQFSTSEQRRNRMHLNIKSNVKFYWGVKFDFVYHMTNIRSLTLDVEHAFCHVGCCRTKALQWMLDMFRSRFYPGDDHTYLQQLLDQGLRITVEGFWKNTEKEIFQGLEFPVSCMGEEKVLVRA